MVSSEAKTWCSDTLHSILGCSDSALAAYLSSEASKAKSYHTILSILHEGGVTPVNASSKSEQDQILVDFSRELFHKCQAVKQKLPSEKATSSRKTNADWIASAANYDLVRDETPQIKIPKKSSSSIVRENLKPPLEISIQENAAVLHTGSPKKDDIKDESSKKRSRDSESKLSRQRRHHRRDRSSDSSSGEEAVDVRRKYEEKKQEKRQRKSKTRKDENSDVDANHVSDQNSENDDDLTTEQIAERERQRDIKERDEFAKRLVERDKRKNASKIDAAAQSEHLQKIWDMEARLAKGEEVIDEHTGRKVTLGSLREESRRVYLKKRTEQKISLLEREIEDEEELFEGQELTEGEKQRLQLRKDILKLARKKEGKEKDEEGDGFYRLPDDYEEQEGRTKAQKASKLLKSRYVEEKGEKSEQVLWEESQTRKAQSSLNRKKTKDEKEYDLVFDDQIDFIMTDKRQGYDNRANKSEELRRDQNDISASSRSRSESDTSEQDRQQIVSKQLTEHEKILAGRKMLPVYPYREEFLAAVKEHQVLILVGETGSGKT